LFKNILVPTDGSELAVKAVEQSVLFAKEVGANNAAVLLRISVSFTPVTRPFGRQTHLLFSAGSRSSRCGRTVASHGLKCCFRERFLSS
jgi:hypothetical protein